MRTLAAILLILLSATSAAAATYGPYQEETYTACGDPSSQLAVAIVHGGWNTAGSQNADAALLLCRFAAARGIYAVSIGYRLVASQTTAWPAQWQDTQTAVRWLRKSHKTVGLVGISAGGYDALGASLRAHTIHWTPTDPSNEAALYPDQASEPDFVVAISPYSNLSDRALYPAAVNSNIASLTAAGVSSSTALTVASPLSLLRSDAPPTLIFHGIADPFVPVAESRALVAEMQYIGARVTYIETPGQHALAGLDWTQRRLLLQQIVNFAHRGHV